VDQRESRLAKKQSIGLTVVAGRDGYHYSPRLGLTMFEANGNPHDSRLILL
jgi:hypothetical protein